MKIRINGADADIQIENEKIAGEVLSALDSWLNGTGHRLSGLTINGRTIHSGDMEDSFAVPVEDIDTMEITTSSIPELIAESLYCLLEDIDGWKAAAFSEKDAFVKNWKETPEAQLLAEQYSDLFSNTIKMFSGEGCDSETLRTLTQERLRELHDPAGEIGRMSPLTADICARLEELPLDIQTGKDAKAAETINIFSGVAEKVFRIINVFRLEGFPVDSITAGDKPLNVCITEFGSSLRELLVAYEQHDPVLVGDLAEYEMAPRLRGLYEAVSAAAGGKNNERTGT